MQHKEPNFLIIAIVGFIISLCFVMILVVLSGCATTLGIADRPAMMAKWKQMKQDKGVTVGLLNDINLWADWYMADGNIEPDVIRYGNEGGTTWKYKRGVCVSQADLKVAILDELGIPHRRYICTIKRDIYNPIGHAFITAPVGDQWIILDNGVVQDVPWEWKAAIKSTWGISHVEEVKEYIHLD